MIKNSVQKFGKFLSGMVMPNIGAFIAWGFITALFIDVGWFPNAELAKIVDPMLKYLLPILIAIKGGAMVAGERGGVIAAIAVIGVIVGSNVTMFIGAMLMGPLAGYVIKKFDQATKDKIPAGFEMLVNNFSIGIIGLILSVIGFYAIGPIISSITSFLASGVGVIVENKILPLVSIFIEPAKVLFLNNAINHGILSPIGAEQALESGKSIMYMLESNPGPGLGVLLAYCFWAKGSIRTSAPGAAIIHFFGGIHEIYFPYILMNPILIIAPILGSSAAILFYSILNVGLVGPASPGSIIAFVAMSPKTQILIVLAGVVISTIVSFLVASPFVKRAASSKKDLNLEGAKKQLASMKFSKSTVINKIVFACDAGMGSSAMGATKFRKRIKEINPNIVVINSSVDTVPSDTDIIVCQEILKERATKAAPNAELITIQNFLQDENLDRLYEKVKAISSSDNSSQSELESIAEPKQNNILTPDSIKLGLKSISKEQAIREAGKLLYELGYVKESYIESMVEREKTTTTYMGLGVAIPHGTAKSKSEVLKSGIVFLQYPEGIDFGNEKAYIIFGIAGIGDEHLEILQKLSEIIEDKDILDKIIKTTDKSEILEMFS